MPDWSSIGQVSRAICYPDYASVTDYHVTVATANGANTKSAAWVELEDSTPIQGILNIQVNAVTYASDEMFDIAIGAAGSEVILINNLQNSMPATTDYAPSTLIQTPLFIPAGTRLSAKSQSTYAGVNNIRLRWNLMQVGGFLSETPLTWCDTYGASTADSGGVSIDPGAAAHAKGNWSEITSATTRHHKALMFIIGGQNNTARTTGAWMLDIAVGAAGSEVPFITDFGLNCYDTGDLVRPKSSNIFPISIPSGTRISARAQSSITDSTDRKFDIIVYCFS